MKLFSVPSQSPVLPAEPAAETTSNLNLWQQMLDLARLRGITSEIALGEALTAWITAQKVVRMPR